jgi:hypothetical protein
VIVAHHAGEELVLLLAASGAGAGSMVVLAVWRARVSRFVGRMRRR